MIYNPDNPAAALFDRKPANVLKVDPTEFPKPTNRARRLGSLFDGLTGFPTVES
jgi:hypothetical protein